MANLFPLSGQAYVDTGGIPYASAKLYTYETGSTTNKATYSNAGLTSANANPVVAGSDGVFGDIYLLAGRYKMVLKTSADVTLQTWDPWDASLELIAASAAPSPTYPFMRYHNTSDGHVYRRDSTNASWIDEGPVDSIGNAATVTQQLAGTSTAVYSTPDSVAAIWQRGTDITPSAGAVSLPATGGNVYNINAGNFSSISSAQGGRIVYFEFAGASTITHNASSLDLPGNANITTAAGDRAAFVNLAAQDASGSNWRCLWFTRDDGSLGGLVPATQAQQESGSAITNPVTPGRQHFHPSAAKAWINFNGSGTPAARDSYNVSSITDNGVGDYTLNFSTSFSGANYGFAASCGSATSTNVQVAFQGSAAPTASAFRVRTYDLSATAFVDATWIGAVFYGDFA